ncbi:MAG: hypothetical protein JWO33_2526 [Caulobacteraceae bacterium]|nr:hypothetical protein [Caulobacteraceae bacterium]
MALIPERAEPSKVQRPNTVAGLVAKRNELLRVRKGLERDLRGVTSDIDHLDAAIRLFDPANTPEARKRYATKHRAKKGTVQRFVLAALRDATEPITSRQITEAWLTARGLRTDEATFVLIRKRIGACLTKLRDQGQIISAGYIDAYVAWELAGKTI